MGVRGGACMLVGQWSAQPTQHSNMVSLHTAGSSAGAVVTVAEGRAMCLMGRGTQAHGHGLVDALHVHVDYDGCSSQDDNTPPLRSAPCLYDMHASQARHACWLPLQLSMAVPKRATRVPAPAPQATISVNGERVAAAAHQGAAAEAPSASWTGRASMRRIVQMCSNVREQHGRVGV